MFVHVVLSSLHLYVCMSKFGMLCTVLYHNNYEQRKQNNSSKLFLKKTVLKWVFTVNHFIHNKTVIQADLLVLPADHL